MKKTASLINKFANLRRWQKLAGVAPPLPPAFPNPPMTPPGVSALAPQAPVATSQDLEKLPKSLTTPAPRPAPPVAQPAGNAMQAAERYLNVPAKPAPKLK